MMLRKAYNFGILSLFTHAIAVFSIIFSMAASSVMAMGKAAQTSFLSPRQAVDALVAAVQDDNNSELLSILGPESADLISSGDTVADRNGRARFLKAYNKKNSLDQTEEGRAVLIVGNRDYPFPIPIIRQGDEWLFDTGTGKDEIINRRIGRNELHTIEVMQAYTDAQREYACIKRDGGGPEFAQKFASSEGMKDGLYWEAEDEAEGSPFGKLIARAAEEGYEGGLGHGSPEAFHGYYFKILKGQGGHANGGAFDYVADGKMVLGFALVAYPAKYGSSGIMTFIINQEGVIYEKDLGEDTVAAAAAMAAFNPDNTWHRYQDLPLGPSTP